MGAGRYHGELDVRFLDGGRVVQLLAPFSYTDPQGMDWPVPKDARVDGASIPRPLWTLIGAPFTGRYRDASVIHDWYCDLRSRPWRDTHRVFYHGMITSGVDAVQARVMYAGVYAGGPRWSETVVHNARLKGRRGDVGALGHRRLGAADDAEIPPLDFEETDEVVVRTYKLDVPDDLYGRLQAEVSSGDLDLGEIERLADRLAPDPHD